MAMMPWKTPNQQPQLFLTGRYGHIIHGLQDTRQHYVSLIKEDTYLADLRVIYSLSLLQTITSTGYLLLFQRTPLILF